MQASKVEDSHIMPKHPLGNVLFICNFDLLNYTDMKPVSYRNDAAAARYNEQGTQDALNNTIGRIAAAFGPGKNCATLPVFDDGSQPGMHTFHNWYWELSLSESIPPGRLTVYLTTEEQIVWCQLAF